MSDRKLRVEAFGATHTGRQRDKNEDAFAVLTPCGVFMVADGFLAVGDGGLVTLAHVGDSRCYRYRQGQLERLTEDHVFFNECMRWGVPAEIAAAHPHRALLTRALGLKQTVDVSTRREEARPGDVVLLGTDGLHGVVTDREIEAILSELGEIEAGVERLIARANDNGGPDNVTAILVRWA